jgi:hypothetical protein
MKANFSIFPGLHSYRIWTSLNQSDQFWRADSHLQHL